jgi:hypothetical protein
VRVRDVIVQSLDALVHAGLLPDYPPKVRTSTAPPRRGSPFSSDMLRAISLGDRSHPFYSDQTAMNRAVALVESFKASAAATYPRPYFLPHCFGPLGTVPLADAHLHVEEALKSVGLRVTSHNSVANSGSFELAEQTTVEKLPHFYGTGLADRYGRDPWRDPVDLRLVVDIRLVVAPSSGGTLERFAAFELSAPAISLLEMVQLRLAGTFPPSPPAATALIGQLTRNWARRRP